MTDVADLIAANNELRARIEELTERLPPKPPEVLTRSAFNAMSPIDRMQHVKAGRRIVDDPGYRGMGRIPL